MDFFIHICFPRYFNMQRYVLHRFCASFFKMSFWKVFYCFFIVFDWFLLRTSVFCIKIGLFLLKSVCLFEKQNEQQKNRPCARACTPRRRPSRACTGWRAVGFFVVYYCVFNEKHTDFNENTPILIKTQLFLRKTYKNHQKPTKTSK